MSRVLSNLGHSPASSTNACENEDFMVAMNLDYHESSLGGFGMDHVLTMLKSPTQSQVEIIETQLRTAEVFSP
ncbi:hypothetical protein EUGRSUZ_B03058 [Eucalyptus grandis]|uniref:Uncharacterized protein n=2 Tax=Eucalyptus grandis TaxID=71139 RepID=A0ACC3LWD9_EUCGR|nr:hypothetical protein EUGRSUZ_B03058 [Eucalyptus grandis]